VVSAAPPPSAAVPYWEPCGLARGRKGAAIDAGVGAGAGTAVQVLTKGQQIKIPSETRLDFALEQLFDITYVPIRS
jgi:hypothetical protein